MTKHQPQQPKVEFITYVALDMSDPTNKIEALGEPLPDGTQAIAIGPDAVLKVDYLGLSKVIGTLQAIQWKMEHGRATDRGLEGPGL